MGFYKLNYGFIKDGEKTVDEVMAVRLKAPKSYTCEDIVEINCHGGTLVSEKVLELVLRNGARHAESGEFTKRAFMNGRIDLSQAEAVMDIIQGKTEKSVSLSLDQLRGDLRDKVNEFKKALLDITAHVNVVLDYPEEGIDDPLPVELRDNLEKVYEEANRLIDSYDTGKKIKEGINLDTPIDSFTNKALELKINFIKRAGNVSEKIKDLLLQRNTISNIVLDSIQSYEKNTINMGSDYFDKRKISDILNNDTNPIGIKFIRELIELSIANFTELNDE